MNRIRAARPVCYRCLKPEVACICASIERVPNRTGVVILQHPHERFHPIGSARIARLGLTRIRIEACAPWAAADPGPMPAGAALLYPAAGARELGELPAEERPRHLVVIDGTWFNAKKIYDAHAWLRALPCVRLTPSEATRYRIRRQPRRHCVATLEAIVWALRLLEPDTRGLDGLLDSFAAMVDRQAAYAPRRESAPAEASIARIDAAPSDRSQHDRRAAREEPEEAKPMTGP